MTIKESLSAFQGFVIEAPNVLVGWYAVVCLRVCGAGDRIWGWVGPVMGSHFPPVLLVITAVLRDAGSVYQLRTILAPEEQWPCVETFLVITTGKVLLALNEWRPELLLTSAHQHTIHRTASTPKNYPA